MRRLGIAKRPAERCLTLKKRDAGLSGRTLEPELLDFFVQLQREDSRLNRVACPLRDTYVPGPAGGTSMRCGNDQKKREHALAVRLKPWRTSDGQGASLKWDPGQIKKPSKSLTRKASLGFGGASGIRTPDLRIMIPSL